MWMMQTGGEQNVSQHCNLSNGKQVLFVQKQEKKMEAGCQWLTPIILAASGGRNQEDLGLKSA
jgi:hypothetical protein